MLMNSLRAIVISIAPDWYQYVGIAETQSKLYLYYMPGQPCRLK